MPDKKERLPIVAANAREVHIIEFIAGLDVQLTDGCEILKDRLNLIPNGWRNFRLAQATVSRLMDKIYETLPDKTLRHMARLCANGEIVIRPKAVIPRLDDAQIVLNEDLRVLVNHAMAAECAMCLKDPREQKKCELRRAMENVAPTAEIHKNGLCSYVDVAAAHGLGDYFGEVEGDDG